MARRTPRSRVHRRQTSQCDHRDVTDGWTIASTVAVGGSAVVTAIMAWYTRSVAQRSADVAELTKTEVEAVVRQGVAIERQAAATTEQARLAESALAAQVQPWLTLGNAQAQSGRGRAPTPPLLVGTSGERLTVSIAVRNVGNGLALLDARSSFLIGWSDPRAGDELMPFTWATVADPVLPPGAQTRVEYAVDPARWSTDIEKMAHLDRNWGELAIDVVYGDALGLRRSRVRVRLAGTETGGWVAFELHYFSPADSETAFATVRAG